MESGARLIWTQCLIGFLVLGCYADKNVPAGATTISCFECNSEYDPRCGDPFDSYSIGQINCSMKRPQNKLIDLPPTLCRKITQKVNGKIRVIRSCGYIRDERDDKACVRRTGTHDVTVDYCACTKPFCNGIENTRSSFTLITSAILTTIACLLTAA